MLKRLALALQGNSTFWLTRLDSGTLGKQQLMDFFFFLGLFGECQNC